MSTTQVRITIPNKLKELVDVLASRYGMGTASYIKHLIVEEIKRLESIPVRIPSKSTIEAIKQADKEYKEGKTIKIPADKLDEYFKNL